MHGYWCTSHKKGDINTIISQLYKTNLRTPKKTQVDQKKPLRSSVPAAEQAVPFTPGPSADGD